MNIAYVIRSHVVEHYIEPARRRGREAVTVVAGDVLRALGYGGGRAPAVCSALQVRKFLRKHGLTVDVQGPPSKQSTTTTFTLCLSGRRELNDGRRVLDPRGIVFMQQRSPRFTARRVPHGMPPLRRRRCSCCARHPAKYMRRGRVKADRHHDMCRQCYRAVCNRRRAKR